MVWLFLSQNNSFASRLLASHYYFPALSDWAYLEAAHNNAVPTSLLTTLLLGCSSILRNEQLYLQYSDPYCSMGTLILD